MPELKAITDALAAISLSDANGDTAIFYDVHSDYYRCRGCAVTATKYTRPIHREGCLVDALDRAQGLVDG